MRRLSMAWEMSRKDFLVDNVQLWSQRNLQKLGFIFSPKNTAK